VKYLSDDLGFTKSIIDPCLLYKKDIIGTVYLCLFVDDVLCIGDRPAIDKDISGIKKRFTIKQMRHMDECSCSFRFHIFGQTKFSKFLRRKTIASLSLEKFVPFLSAAVILTRLVQRSGTYLTSSEIGIVVPSFCISKLLKTLFSWL
jgi:hypothetical protein